MFTAPFIPIHNHVVVSRYSDEISVKCPYSDEFASLVDYYDAEWDSRFGRWIFQRDHEDDILELVQECFSDRNVYHVDGITGEVIDENQ